MPRFVCIKKCQFNDVVEEGQILSFLSLEHIPFSIRPFFKPEPTREEMEAQITEEEEAKARLRNAQAELDELGIAYDRNAGIVALEEMITLARRDATGGAQTKPVDRMNKLELQEKCRLMGIEFDEEDIKAKLIDKIKQAEDNG